MTKDNQRGFTIIELLLFFSISGLMFVALMAGVSTNINTQRYRDSVATLSGVFQQQYSEVSNTRNDRDDRWRCGSDSVVVPDVSVNAQARGTTQCVVMGRYVRSIEAGKKIETGNIVGVEPALGTLYTSDADALKAYNPKVSSFGQEIRENEWGAILKDTSGGAANFSILILRSPQSGLVRVFALASPMPAQLTDMMTEEAASRQLITCVTSDVWVAGGSQAVILNANTAGPNGVEIRGDVSGC